MWLTFAITGSEKRCDQGAPLFTVRVDGVVGHHCFSTFLRSVIDKAGFCL